MSGPSEQGKPFNVVLFGETGGGKSSLINMLAGSDTAVTSNKAIGCTTSSKSYDIPINKTPFKFWDTAGLNETDRGTVASNTAFDQLGQLFERLNDEKSEGGISLLLYCVAGVGFREIMRVNYDLVWGIMCQMQIPVLVVVTKQEHAVGDQWWDEHQSNLVYNYPEGRHGPTQKAVCVTTTRGKNNLFDAQYKQSTLDVQNAILKYASQTPMTGKIEPKWFSSGESRKMAENYLRKFRTRSKKERSVFNLINKRNAKRASAEAKSRNQGPKQKPPKAGPKSSSATAAKPPRSTEDAPMPGCFAALFKWR